MKYLYIGILSVVLIGVALCAFNNKDELSNDMKIKDQLNVNIKKNNKNIMGQKILKIGESVYFTETTKIIFKDVMSDNRCPQMVNCVIRGEAVVKLEIIDDISDFSKAYITEVNISGMNRDEHGNLKKDYITDQNHLPYLDNMITVLDLAPYPKAPKDVIQKEEYELLINISKK